MQLQEDIPSLNSRTYGAPALSFSGSGERFRSLGDPISMFDFGARETAPTTWNPHSYQDVANRTEPPPEHETPESKIGTITDGTFTAPGGSTAAPAAQTGVDYEIA